MLFFLKNIVFLDAALVKGSKSEIIEPTAKVSVAGDILGGPRKSNLANRRLIYLIIYHIFKLFIFMR